MNKRKRRQDNDRERIYKGRERQNTLLSELSLRSGMELRMDYNYYLRCVLLWIVMFVWGALGVHSFLQGEYVLMGISVIGVLTWLSVAKFL